MKVEEIIKYLDNYETIDLSDEDCKMLTIMIGNNGSATDFINATDEAIKFLKAYQERVKELEEALELIRQAKSKLRTVEDYDDYTEMCIEGELYILTGFY